MQTISIFELIQETFKINKPIKLIELFAGVGSQAMSLRNIGANFAKHCISEWEVNAFRSYKAIHHPEDRTNYSQKHKSSDLPKILFEYGISNDGVSPMTLEQIERRSENWQRETYNNIKATNNLVNIMKTKGKDLKIKNTEDYCYILTYSFPCQDLSVAGSKGGMTKGSGTRSGLLWEVERIIEELEELPQVLLMENVPQVLAQANIGDFHLWQNFLERKGYSNHTSTLNARNFGIPQNRNRTFMVSILGDYYYKFPYKKPLKKTLKDFADFEMEVPRRILESYSRKKGDFGKRFYTRRDVSACLVAKSGYATITQNYYTEDFQRHTIEDVINKDIKVYANSPEMNWKLMGFTEQDFRRAKKVNNDTQLYKQAGNSIATNVLEEIFKQML